MPFFVQREIAFVTKEAAHKQNEKTTLQSQMAKGALNAIQNATKKTLTSICGKKFKKNLGHG